MRLSALLLIFVTCLAIVSSLENQENDRAKKPKPSKGKGKGKPKPSKGKGSGGSPSGGKGSGGKGKGSGGSGGNGSGSGVDLQWEKVFEVFDNLKATLKALQESGAEVPSGSGTGGSGTGGSGTTPDPTSTAAPPEPIDIDWTFGMTPKEINCVVKGTKINFKWSSGHNVVKMASKEDYDSCSNFSSTSGQSGPFTFIASTVGTHYFTCGIGNGFHCGTGNMKAKITVADTC